MEKLVCQENLDVFLKIKKPQQFDSYSFFNEQNNLIKLTEDQINKTSA